MSIDFWRNKWQTIVAMNPFKNRPWRVTKRILVSNKEFQPAQALLMLNKEARNQQELWVISHLRRRVNEWINSGRLDDGTEQPFLRHLSAYETESPYQSVCKWFELHPGRIAVEVEANVNLWICDDWKSSFEPHSQSACFDEAMGYFTVLVIMKWSKYSIARCINCFKYYFLSRPREVYKRGTRCRTCQRRSASKSEARPVRAAQRNARLQRAAQLLAGWERLKPKSRSRYVDFRQYIAARMNRQGVTKKWVTRNFKFFRDIAKEI